jgi:transposase
MPKDGRRLPHNLLEKYRLAAINLYQSKVDIKVIAESFGVSAQAVYKWVWKFQDKGLGSLKSTVAQGVAPQLSQQQFKDLLHNLGQPATSAEYGTALWSSSKVRLLIKRLFNVDYHPKHMPRFLRRLGLSLKKPQLRPSKQDPPQIRQWKEQRLPELLTHVKEKNALLFYADESLVSFVPSTGKTWTFPKARPSGRVPAGEGESFGIMAAVNEQGRTYFELTRESDTSAAGAFLRFIRNLMEDFPSRNLVLIVDAAPAHTDKDVRAFQENCPQLLLEIMPTADFEPSQRSKEAGPKQKDQMKGLNKDDITPTDS